MRLLVRGCSVHPRRGCECRLWW